MSVLWYMPLERIDMRYTEIMDDDICQTIRDLGFNSQRLYPEIKQDDGLIPSSQFLDWSKTSAFKAAQLGMVARAFHEGRVTRGDAFFVSDLWYPGIESIRYMSELSGIRVSIHGIMHAGSWVPSDDVARLKYWVRNSEKGWFDAATNVYLGSEFHKNLILKSGVCEDPSKLIVTGLPFPPGPINEARRRAAKKSVTRTKKVVCTGRIHKEKRHDLVEEVRKILSGEEVEFVTTHGMGLSKADYFDLLSSAEVVFSAAEQENFGYGVLEAVALGCFPVVPDSLSYREMYPRAFRYTVGDTYEAAELIKRCLTLRKEQRVPGNLGPLAFTASHYYGCTKKILEDINRFLGGSLSAAAIGDDHLGDNCEVYPA